ncbi:flagellar hook-associated protein FlgK [Paracoccus seriniphilus]|uniref:flagellar hook-associated protein FlgK n=1 Tax=Paracoccus seriniphilus TaxID=184748 RepID=UPI0035615AD3
MSIATALNHALSGLTATAKGTETVASNLANVMTPGYARREVALSSQALGGGMGGVRIDGVARLVDANLVSGTRLASAAKAETSVLADFFAEMGAVIGMPGEESSLGTALSEFQSSLQSAASRPDDDLRLEQVVDAAMRLARALNDSSQAVQDSRTMADAAIAAGVAALNEGLETVAMLNRQIARSLAEQDDVSGLEDQRQATIDRISEIVPVQEVGRDHGAVALFTAEGAPLLDGSRPAQISYTSVGQMTPEMVVETAPVGRLVLNGEELSEGRMQLFAGGTLSANFDIRDEHASRIQEELDALAFDLHERILSADLSLSSVDTGLFTDAGSRASAEGMTGLAARIDVNSAVKPDSGAVWRVRSGLAAPVAGAVGDSSFLTAMGDAMNSIRSADAFSPFIGSASLQGRFADLEARVATRRVNAESDATMRSSQWEVVSGALMADGVDSDAEMQRLLQYEQAYAANARVVQAIEEMMDQILRI